MSLSAPVTYSLEEADRLEEVAEALPDGKRSTLLQTINPSASQLLGCVNGLSGLRSSVSVPNSPYQLCVVSKFLSPDSCSFPSIPLICQFATLNPDSGISTVLFVLTFSTANSKRYSCSHLLAALFKNPMDLHLTSQELKSFLEVLLLLASQPPL
ncbi:hypothetical protein GYMLUDRAFT_771634 [Collybiopsis luxurians FD-317 M1]|uniref:Uncharacterized protein n=1 Tax=Collybiopsis luxurians FD-317 M1 TaxID=944289 RepID=A0A0D0CP37_9AGAR|nr:hypothetical protein GYMLUDRAFT_771634 [Collybiopsis luxurians FD-317 M1]